jgi:ribonucleoside-diphosphate reductase alpha chain
VPEFWRKQGRTAARRPPENPQQVFDRLAGTWTYWGWKGGYFDEKKDARPSTTNFATCWRASQLAAMVNTGCTGLTASMAPARAITMSTIEGRLTKWPAYEHPQPIPASSSIKDDLVNEGGIMDLWTREARLFKWFGYRHEFSPSRAPTKNCRAAASLRP